MTRKYFYFDVDNGRRYSLKLELDHIDSTGRAWFNYVLKNPDKKILFDGADFSVSYRWYKWKENAMSLMGFLTCKQGDVDAEYFKDYTPDQLAFTESMDCEELSLMVYDYENKGEG